MRVVDMVYGGLDEIFWASRPLIGMVHLPALPGSPRDTGGGMDAVLERAILDTQALEDGGATAIMVENFFDAPFTRDCLPPHSIAGLTFAVAAVRAVTNLPIGVNALRNDARSAIAIAHICGCQFVRINVFVGAAVTDQGLIQGAARDAVMYRKELNADIALFADVFVKHAQQLAGGSLEDAARDAVERGMADALIVSGPATGAQTDPAFARRVRDAVPATPLLIGSGFSKHSAGDILAYANGAIVGTSVKVGGSVAAPVDAERVRELRTVMLAV